MTNPEVDQRYPIGVFKYDGDSSRRAIDQSIQAIASLPGLFRESVAGLNTEQFDTPYRDGGWTVRQLVHHVPDSHMNAYIRCKLALTEDTPTIKPYDEAAFARLGDIAIVPVEVSLGLLDKLHERFTALLNSMSDDDFKRCYVHPDYHRAVPLREVVALYAWHGRHHTAHITALRERRGWT
ncbi:MAG: YfiT family bacillithiol transferase [Gemmatimonadaceae bacterium]